VRSIDAHREEFGVEPICRVLQFAPSTYDAAKSRPPNLREMDSAGAGPIPWVACLKGEYLNPFRQDPCS